MGKTYITPDAKYAKETCVTICYKKPKIKRILKAKKLGFDIYGYIYNDYKNIYILDKNENLISITEENVLENINYVKNWDLEYDYTDSKIIKYDNNKYQNELEKIVNPLFPLPFLKIPNKKLEKYQNFFDLNDNLFKNILIKKIINSIKNYKKINNDVNFYRFNFQKNLHQTILTEVIEMKKGTILNKNEEYRPEDYLCDKFYIPMGKEFGSEKTKKLFEQIDENFNKILGPEIKKIFDNKSEIHYESIIRKNIPEKKENEYNRIKILIPSYVDKISNYPRCSPDSEFKINIDLIKDGNIYNITTMDELREKFPFGSKASFELVIDSLRIGKNLFTYKDENKMRLCHFVLSCKTIIIHKDLKLVDKDTIIKI